MLNRLFKKPLLIKLENRVLKFDSRNDFEFALSSRTEVPAAKISELVRFNARQLLEEAKTVRQVERNFVETLSQSLQEPGSIGYLLREIDSKMFSQDHDWRAIMQDLAQQAPQFDDYKQLALVKYMQYLASRQDVLKGIYSHKVSSEQNPEVETDPMQDPRFKQTLIFDISKMPASASAMQDASGSIRQVVSSDLVQLPRGETIMLDLSGTRADKIQISRHLFSLRSGDPPMLIDDNGREHELHKGRNVLGRHPESDIMIDSEHRDVSRTHAVIELLDDGTLQITDLSSHGTFVAAEAIHAN